MPLSSKNKCRRSCKASRAAERLLRDDMISLVHPLVQVYTIPTTGVQQWIRNLPVRPADMPFVLVKPRKYQKPRPPVPVDTQKVKRAFEWLKANNPYYYNIEWGEDNEAAWADEAITSHLSVDQLVFEEWVGQEDRMVFETAATFAQLFPETDKPRWHQVRNLLGGCFRVAKTITSNQIYDAMVGAAQLEMISRRLEQAAKFRYRECMNRSHLLLSVVLVA